MNYLESVQNNNVSTGYVYRPEVVSKSFSDSIAELKESGLIVVDSPIDNTSPSTVLNKCISNRFRARSSRAVEFSLGWNSTASVWCRNEGEDR